MTRKSLGVASIAWALLVLLFAQKGLAERDDDHRGNGGAEEGSADHDEGSGDQDEGSGDRDNEHRRKGVNVVEATYGGITFPVWATSCPVVTSGNVTALVHKACAGLKSCSYLVDVNVLGDPDPGCYKSFSVTWQCGRNSEKTQTISLGGISGDANGKTVVLDCPIQ